MEKELTIGGMSCQHCVHAVRQALSQIDGLEVRDVEIGVARVAVTEGSWEESRVREALDEEGYPLERVSK